MQTLCKAGNCRFPDTHVTKGHKCGKCHHFGHGQKECGNDFSSLSSFLYETVPNHLQCTISNCHNKTLHLTRGHYCYACSNWGKCTCNDPKTETKISCPICRAVSSYSDKEDLKIFGVEQKCSVCMDSPVNILLPTCKHACLCMTCLANMLVLQKPIVLYPTNPNDDMGEVISSAETKIGNRNNVYTVINSGQGCCWYVKRVNNEINAFFLHGDNHGQYGQDTNHIPLLQAFLTNCVEI